MTRCRNQVRTAGQMGHVIGFDLPALLQVARLLGYDVAAMAELVPEAEAGMLEGMAEKAEREGPG